MKKEEISERKRVEEALRESEQRYRTLFESTLDGAFVIDAETMKVVLANKATANLFGFDSAEDVIGMNTLDFVPPDDRDRVIRIIVEDMFAKDLRQVNEFQAVTRDGREIWIRAVGVTTKYQGRLAGLVSFCDITERKRMEEALQAEKNKLQAVIDAIGHGISIQDRDYNIIYQNEPSRMTGGYHLGEKCYRGFESQEKVCDGCPVEKAFKDGRSHTSERRIVTLSGKVVFLENTASPIRDARGKIVSCLEIGRDITKRKQVEEALRRSREKLRKMFESVTDGISVVDLNGVITEVNQRAVEMHGFNSKDELLRRGALELVTPRDREKVANNMRQALKQGALRGVEYTLLRADGTEFPGELSTSVLRDASGRWVGHITIARDITERKQAEEEEKRLQQELYLTRRLASIGELAAGVAHEINNPLTGILGFSQRLLKKSTSEEVSHDLEIIHSEAQRAARVVQNLLTFARRREPKKEYSNINDILQKALELRAYELKTSNIEVVTDLAPHLPEIMVDSPQIQEVFLNIILNAEQAMSETHGGGKLIIKTRQTEGHIRISFTDDGPGIPAEHLEKVFDPFFTTRAEKGGTGLGLSACHGIVTEHGGKIYVKSKMGKGATFRVELPLSPVEANLGHIH